jgi:hypothetical protein
MRPSSSGAIALVSLLSVASLGRAAEYVNDPLTSADAPGRGVQGGSFDANGWTTTSQTDAVWWEIPDALPSGAVEYTLTGISPSTTLNGADHDILAIYQAPSDAAEPIGYSPWFRNNDFKAFTRIFGTQEPGRAGAMKLELAVCPRGEPWYHDTACDPACGGNYLAYANGVTTDVGWDPTASYRMRLAWGPGTFSFGRDGVELASLEFPGTYAPKPLRVRLGSPRHGTSDVAYMPVGLTFKDMVVTGEPGSMTVVCGAEVPDGGAPDASTGDDAGTLPGTTLAAIQDVTAASWEAGVFPDVMDLNIEGDGTSPTAVVYVSFPAPSGYVESAWLALRTQSSGSASGGAGVVHGVSTAFDESTLTWGNKPAYAAEAHGAPQSIDADNEMTWDVTQLVRQGITGFAVVSTDPDGAHYVSKEAGGSITGPRLMVTITDPPDASAPDASMPDASDVDASVDSGPTVDDASADGGPGPGAGGSGGTGTASAGGHGGTSPSTGGASSFPDASANGDGSATGGSGGSVTLAPNGGDTGSGDDGGCTLLPPRRRGGSMSPAVISAAFVGIVLGRRRSRRRSVRSAV